MRQADAVARRDPRVHEVHPEVSFRALAGVPLGFANGGGTRGGRTAYPYMHTIVRSNVMEVSARLSSKGQVTVPRAVREALELEEGDRIVFRVEGRRAVLARTPELLALAGSVSVPAGKRGTPWADVLRETRRTRADARR
jgi:antitoxin PrlF